VGLEAAEIAQLGIFAVDRSQQGECVHERKRRPADDFSVRDIYAFPGAHTVPVVPRHEPVFPVLHVAGRAGGRLRDLPF